MGIKKENILVIDNTTSIVSPWKNEIREKYNLIETIGWFEAMKKIESNGISLLIVNISLPQLNGVEAIRKIRKKFSKIPIILIISQQDKDKIKIVSDYRIQGFITLPINVTELLDKISNFVKPFPQEEQKEEIVIQRDTQKNNFTNLPEKYYEGQSHFIRGEFDNAINIFSSLSEEKRLKSDAWLKYVEDSQFQLGRCWIKKNDYGRAIETLTQFIQKSPRNDNIKKAIFYIGESYESLNETNKAVNFYRKIIGMGGFDSIVTQAKKKIKKIQNGSN